MAMTISPRTQITFWAGALALFVGTLWLFNGILTPFILGIVIAYLLDPIVRKFAVEKGLPRWVISLVILILFFAFLAALVLILGPMAYRQLSMLVDQLPGYIEGIRSFIEPYIATVQDRLGVNYIEKLNENLKDNAGKIVGVTGGILGGLATGGAAIVDFATTLFLAPLVAFFMMNEWPRIVKWVEDLYPRQHEKTIRGLFAKIDRKISGFIRGQILVAFILGIFYAVALSIAGLNYGFLIGIGAGLFSIIPFVGSTLGLITAVGVAWFQAGDLVYVAIIAGIFLGGQFVEGNFLTPKLVGDSVGLHPLWVLFALIAGGSLLGIVGMLLAVPVAAVIGVLAGFAVERYKDSPFYKAPPEEPSTILLHEDDHTPPPEGKA